MTDKQEPDIVERLRKYPADPTMCDDYSAAMLDAADEIERLREQMSMMAQYGKPPAQPDHQGHSCTHKCTWPQCEAAQPAPAQEPQPVSNTDELPQRLSDERAAFEAWHNEYRTQELVRRDDTYYNTHVRCRWEGWQARAIEAALQPGWRDIESAPKDELILVGPTKRMGICVAMHHSRDGWVTETTSEWVTMYTPTHWMPLPPAPKGQS